MNDIVDLKSNKESTLHVHIVVIVTSRVLPVLIVDFFIGHLPS